MLKARVATAVLLLPPVLWAIHRGGLALAALLAVVGLLAGWEAAGLLAAAVRAAPVAGEPAGSTGAAGSSGICAAAGTGAPPVGYRSGATGEGLPGQGAAARGRAGRETQQGPLPPAVRGACALGGALPAIGLALLPWAPLGAMAAGGVVAGAAAAVVARAIQGTALRTRRAATSGASQAEAAPPSAAVAAWAIRGEAAQAIQQGGPRGTVAPGRTGIGGGRAFLLAASAALWVGVPLAHALWLRQAGVAWLLVPLVILWVQDVAAFFVGRAVGRHRLAPRISPGKTWEGATGGLVAALLAAGVLAGYLGVHPAALLPAAAVVAVAGQAGDLFESWWKRRAGLKDSGSLLPGHGGMLDRIDSLLPALVLFTWWMRPWP